MFTIMAVAALAFVAGAAVGFGVAVKALFSPVGQKAIDDSLARKRNKTP